MKNKFIFLLLSLNFIVITANSQTTGTIKDSRDNIVYKTVKVGNQTWMAENLNYYTSSGSWCYDNSSSNCSKYGRLYNWETAKNICPNGWHIPSKTEFETMINYIGNNSGSKLKSSYGWEDNGNGTNTYAFYGMPSGFSTGRGFVNINSLGGFWTSSEIDQYKATSYLLSCRNEILDEGWDSKSTGVSVRCVCDFSATPNAPNNSSSSTISDFLKNKGVEVLAGLAHPSNTYKSGSYNVYSDKVCVKIYYDGYTTELDIKRDGNFFTGINVISDDDFITPFAGIELLKDIALDIVKDNSDEQNKSAFQKKINKKISEMNGKDLACLILSLNWLDY